MHRHQDLIRAGRANHLLQFRELWQIPGQIKLVTLFCVPPLRPLFKWLCSYNEVSTYTQPSPKAKFLEYLFMLVKPSFSVLHIQRIEYYPAPFGEKSSDKTFTKFCETNCCDKFSPYLVKFWSAFFVIFSIEEKSGNNFTKFGEHFGKSPNLVKHLVLIMSQNLVKLNFVILVVC